MPPRAHVTRRWVNLSFQTNIFGIPESEAGEGVGTFMFVNNTVLIVAILLVMVALHVALVSGMDAYRLTRVRTTRRGLRHG